MLIQTMLKEDSFLMQQTIVVRRWLRKPAVTILLFFFVSLLASAPPQKLLAQADTRGGDRGADLEPEISLSAATVTEILRREPGLLLEVKRVLVQKAYEQGRVLDPSDLGDDAVYQLVREDDEVRALATVEIEKREYVRAKPTRQEMEKSKIRRLPNSESGKTSADNDEGNYWSLHERIGRVKKPAPFEPDSAVEDGFAKDGFSKDGGAVDGSPNDRSADATPEDGITGDGSPGEAGDDRRFTRRPRPLPPQPGGNSFGDDRQRQSMAGMEPQNRDSYDAAPPDAGSLPRIGSDGLTGLSSASMEEAGSGYREGAKSSPSYQFSSPGSSFGAEMPGQLSAGNSGFNALNPHLDTRTPRPFPSSMEEEEDRPAIHRRANPYAGVPSLYDLYTQVSRRSPALSRFGEDVFRNGTGNFDELPMDMPVGPDYVLGPGDGLSIELWGGISERLQRVVDREGRVALPEAGAVEVTGRSLGEVQQMVQGVLRREFRDVHADVSLARLRTVRVYVVGDVERPGAYDVSSLATPLNALYQAGGPTGRGSLRILRHYRGPQMVEEIDLYDLLLHGVRANLERLRPGDTIMVPPVGAQLTVEGMVRRPAIYELNHESDLAEGLELAGGVLNTGTLRHIEVERVVAHQGRSMLRLDIPENDIPANDILGNVSAGNVSAESKDAVTRALEGFKIQDGDKIRIAPVVASSEQTVYLDGHVFHPGKHAYREGMRVTDLVHSYADLLPEPASQHAEIIRLAPPDYAPQVIAFNLADALAGTGGGNAPSASGGHAGNVTGSEDAARAQNVTLKAFETESSTTTLALDEIISCNASQPYEPAPTTRMSSFFERMRNKASRSNRFSASRNTAAPGPENPEATVPIPHDLAGFFAPPDKLL